MPRAYFTGNQKICFNWLTADQFTRRLAQANLVTKVDIADFVEKTLLVLENDQKKLLNYMPNGKNMKILSIFELIKNTWYKWVNIFLNPNLRGKCGSWIWFI